MVEKAIYATKYQVRQVNNFESAILKQHCGSHTKTG